MSEHTPGPWIYDPLNTGMVFGGHVGILSRPDPESFLTGPTVANVPLDVEESEANARLIAAAPDLLEAVKDLASDECYCGISGFPGPCAYCTARAVIAKAEKGE